MNSGSYQLYILVKETTILNIGSLGKASFPKGYYVYTGSAMLGLRQRVGRHLRKEKKIRWHIDYLLADSKVEIADVKLFPSIKREECKKNLKMLKKPGAWIPVKGFGSSDCNQCPAHLIGFINKIPE